MSTIHNTVPDPSEKKLSIVTARMSQTAKSWLQRQAKRFGLTPSDYLSRLLHQHIVEKGKPGLRRNAITHDLDEITIETNRALAAPYLTAFHLERITEPCVRLLSRLRDPRWTGKLWKRGRA